jgi:hypothetical protein
MRNEFVFILKSQIHCNSQTQSTGHDDLSLVRTPTTAEKGFF